jgi:glycosyltransferase involved in cell wall biosynthesis
MKGWLKANIKNFDIIHMHNFRSYQNNVVHYYAKKYDIPYILHAHGGIPRIIEKQNLKKLYDLVWGNKILRDATKVIAVSKVEIEQYKKMCVDDDKIVVIPNGLDVESFKDLPEYGQFRKKYDIKEKHIILFLGRMHRRKGIDFLIKAFSELKQIEDIVLVIAGPNEGYRTELEKLVKNLNLRDSVKFIDYIDNISEVYQDANVLVYPSLYEIFGLVPFEAIMCGIPVIVTDDCGCGELVREVNCGYLVKYGDVNDLKKKMIHVLENPENGKEMVERGRKYILENLTWEKVASKIEDVYKEILTSTLGV